jgi:hypothetical protein
MYSSVRYSSYVCEVVCLPAKEEYKLEKLKKKAHRGKYTDLRKINCIRNGRCYVRKNFLSWFLEQRD